MALASLREHLDRLLRLEQLRDEPSESDTHFYTVEIALEKMRTELINLAPGVLPVATAFEFQKVPGSAEGYVDVKVRLPKAIDELMSSVRRHWQRQAESVGISPLKFAATPIVRMDDK